MRVLTRTLAATALVAAAGLVGAPGASAAACPAGAGVTVVVDYARSGGSGTVVSCVGDGGGSSASALFGSAGHDLTRVDSQPGAVCKVDGYRTQDACARMPPANAFWGLFWSDGEGGWTFSQEGVDNLDVPAGGSVAWAWQDGGGYDYPSVAPTQQGEPSAEPSPSQPPAGGGGGSTGGTGTGGSGGGGSSTPDAPASTSPTEQPSATADGGGTDRQREPRDGDRPAAGPGAKDRGEKQDAPREEDRARDDRGRDGRGNEATLEAETPATAAEPPSSAPEDGLPVWVGPTAVGVLLPMAGLAAYLRRRNA